MTNPHMRWVLAGCWIAASILVFVAIDASSTRSWMYLTTVALVPPIALFRLWPQPPQLTVDDVMHGRGGQS